MQLIDLPDEAMLIVAEFLKPPEVYRLCLTSKRFFRRVNSTTDESNASSKEGHHHGGGGMAPGALICTKLLRFSLLQSLKRVVRHSRVGKSHPMTSFSEMTAPLPRGSVIISGSTMVQCVLGDVFEDDDSNNNGFDMDVFCTAAAAPAVRSWLVKEAGQFCIGACDQHIGVDNLAQTFMTKIHHAESYGPRPPDFMFDFEQACQNGAGINGRYFPRPFQRLLFTGGDIDQDFESPTYRVQCLPGDPLPFDFKFGAYDMYGEKYKAVDLVVAKANFSSASALLDDFDLTICRACWDGQTFVIPDPHLTFAGCTEMESHKKDLMMSYQRHYDMGNDWDFVDIDEYERLRRIRSTLNRVREDLRDSSPILLEDPEEGDLHQALYDVALHNYIYKLFARLKQYEARGILVEGSPSTSEFQIRGFNALDMTPELWEFAEGV
jgi:hypothetical protein